LLPEVRWSSFTPIRVKKLFFQSFFAFRLPD
jgi:hypothetical protein